MTIAQSGFYFREHRPAGPFHPRSPSEDLLHVLSRELEPHACSEPISLIHHDNAERIKRPNDSVGIILAIDPRAAAGFQKCQSFY